MFMFLKAFGEGRERDNESELNVKWVAQYSCQERSGFVSYIQN